MLQQVSPKISRPFDVTNRMVMSIAVPMTLAAITTPLLGLVDMGVVGQFGKAELIGGLAIGALVFDFLFSIFSFLRTGTTGLVAQALGRADKIEEQAVFWRSAIIALAGGIAMIIALPLILSISIGFMQASAETNAVMITYVTIRMLAAPFSLMNYTVLGLILGRGQGVLGLILQVLLNSINITMSVFLGLKLEWGIEGVAWGTVCGEVIACFVGLAIILRGFNRQPKPELKRIIDRQGLLRMFAINRDLMIRSFLLLIAFAVFTRHGTELGSVTLAANSVLMNFFLIAGFFLDGMATAAEQIVGRAVGANYRPAFMRGVKLTFLWGLIMSAAVSLFILLVGDSIIFTLAKAEDVYQEALVYLPWAACTALTGLLAFHMDGVYVGATWSRDMRNMMFFSLIVFFATLYATKPVIGNHGLWLALNIFLSIRGVTLLALLPRKTKAQFDNIS